MRGKLIVIEGTDCSGKETQSNKLIERLESNGHKVFKFSFPAYNSPTGKIIGGPYLGKPQICESWFSEGAINVSPKIASGYYAIDRAYHAPMIESKLNEGYTVVLDRYTPSNMAHQGGKLKTKEERLEMYNWLDNLEYVLYNIPRPDITFLLYMPYQQALVLRKNRAELPDQHEASEEHLKHAEAAYLELANLYHWNIVNCAQDERVKSREDIHEDLYQQLLEELKR